MYAAFFFFTFSFLLFFYAATLISINCFKSCKTNYLNFWITYKPHYVWKKNIEIPTDMILEHDKSLWSNLCFWEVLDDSYLLWSKAIFQLTCGSKRKIMGRDFAAWFYGAINTLHPFTLYGNCFATPTISDVAKHLFLMLSSSFDKWLRLLRRKVTFWYFIKALSPQISDKFEVKAVEKKGQTYFLPQPHQYLHFVKTHFQ